MIVNNRVNCVYHTGDAAMSVSHLPVPADEYFTGMPTSTGPDNIFSFYEQLAHGELWIHYVLFDIT